MRSERTEKERGEVRGEEGEEEVVVERMRSDLGGWWGRGFGVFLGYVLFCKLGVLLLSRGGDWEC